MSGKARRQGLRLRAIASMIYETRINMNHDKVNFQLSDDQNFLTIEGEQYQAFDAIFNQHSCTNCALFIDGIVSKKCEVSLMNNFCFRGFRNDGREVIWVKKYEN